MLGEASENLAVLAASAAVTMALAAAPPEAALVHADRTRVLQLLLNLLGHAVKYNRPAGRVKTRIERTAGQAGVRVTDTDTDNDNDNDTGMGMGMGLNSATRLAALFRPFERLRREQTGVEGTRLEPVIAHSLVQAMGGRLTAGSEAGVGTRFVMKLPLAAAPAPC